jgi:hypothetical protein
MRCAEHEIALATWGPSEKALALVPKGGQHPETGVVSGFSDRFLFLVYSQAFPAATDKPAIKRRKHAF